MTAVVRQPDDAARGHGGDTERDEVVTDSGPDRGSSSGDSSGRYDDVGDDVGGESRADQQQWFIASDTSSSSSIAVTGLLDELSAIQATYTRLTAALSQSERENLLLVNSLVTVSAERHRLQATIVSERASAAARVSECEQALRRVEKAKERLDFTATAAATGQEQEREAAAASAAASAADVCGLELRVADLEKQNAELRRRLVMHSSSSRMRGASASVERGTNTAQPGSHAELSGRREPDEAEATAADRSPPVAVASTATSSASSPNAGSRPTAVYPPPTEGVVLSSGGGTDSRLAAAHATSSTSSWSPQRADSMEADPASSTVFDPPPLQGSASFASVSPHQVAAREYLHAATVEKLWAMVQCRGRELERVARLLASAESRNVELAKLLFQVYQGVAPATVQEPSSSTEATDSAVVKSAGVLVPGAAAAASALSADGSRALAGGATPGGRAGGAVVVSAATTPTSQQRPRTPQRQRRATTIAVPSSSSPANGLRAGGGLNRAHLTSPTKVPPQRVVPGGFSFESPSSAAVVAATTSSWQQNDERTRFGLRDGGGVRDGGVSPSSTPAAMSIKPHPAALRRHSFVGQRVVEKPRFRF